MDFIDKIASDRRSIDRNLRMIAFMVAFGIVVQLATIIWLLWLR